MHYVEVCGVRQDGRVRVTVRLFAGLRERAGWSQRELDDVARVADVWDALDLGDEPPGLLYALNKTYVERDHDLADGDEVALIPPVSGGAFRLSEQPLSLEAVAAEVASDEAGAVATFVGTTRVHSRGRTVTHLEYEAYEGMAEQVMAEIAEDLKTRFELCEIAIHHRIGRVSIGERSVVIAVSAPHRQDALAACSVAIGTLKEKVPLWKKEVYVGGDEWIGRGS
jgi:molybdopterin synthase catalytic subunit/molybdopterin converting factor small subunit